MDINKISNVVFYFSIFTFIIAFNFAHNPPSGWYQQFMPDLGRPLTDIIFTDSLTGFAILSTGSSSDTNYIMKTSDGGDNWNVSHVENKILKRIIFLNNDTGYVAAHEGTLGYVLRTTNGGTSWSALSILEHVTILDMHILNNHTMWIACRRIPNYEILRTTNGGALWTIQLQQTSPIFDKIYMYDGNIGFVGQATSFANTLYKTTDSGLNWTRIQGENGFNQIQFIDSLTGWKSLDSMRKTTDGGLTWQRQYIPYGNPISPSSRMLRFKVTNLDTIWGSGGFVQYSQNYNRGLLYFSSNGGNNWFYQVPDTSFGIVRYVELDFTNEKTGWAFSTLNDNRNIHTVTGGDTSFLNSIINNTNEIPTLYKLHQNYPNPFNPVTKIRFDIAGTTKVKLIVYDILGKQVDVLIDKKLSSGSYEYTFDARVYGQGRGLPSGVYFYLLITDEAILTKKMLLLK